MFMAARKYTKKERLAHRAEINRLDLRGWKGTEIAQHLGLTQQMVSYHLTQLREEALQSIQDRPLLVAQEAATPAFPYRATIEGWDESRRGGAEATAPPGTAARPITTA